MWKIVGKFRRGIFPREIEHRRRFLLSYANAWLKIQSFSSLHRYSLYVRAHVNIICSYTPMNISTVAGNPPWIARDNFGSFFLPRRGALFMIAPCVNLRNSVSIIFLFPFFRPTIFDRPILRYSPEGGREMGEKEMTKPNNDNNDSKIRSVVRGKSHGQTWNNRRIRG